MGRSLARARALVIQAMGSIGDRAVASAYRSLRIGEVLRFLGRFKIAPHVLPTILVGFSSIQACLGCAAMASAAYWAWVPNGGCAWSLIHDAPSPRA
jgi:hypothetical protein